MAPTRVRPDEFRGFEPAALQFLADLAENNDRAWFHPRKADYERLIKEPFEALCMALAGRFEALRLPLLADPVRSPFRIYRDVRFSKDKSPYKTAQGAQFPWQGDAGGRRQPRAALGVGGYFHLEPGSIFVGGGMWHPDATVLAAFRARVDRDPASVLEAIEDQRFRTVFGTVTGETLRRSPRGYPNEHPYGHLLRLKDVIFSRRLSDREACSPDLPDTLAADLDAARVVLRLLASLAADAEGIAQAEPTMP
jgi:uncharacterized protein (TIGR02453 family)